MSPSQTYSPEQTRSFIVVDMNAMVAQHTIYCKPCFVLISFFFWTKSISIDDISESRRMLSTSDWEKKKLASTLTYWNFIFTWYIKTEADIFYEDSTTTMFNCVDKDDTLLFIIGSRTPWLDEDKLLHEMGERIFLLVEQFLFASKYFDFFSILNSREMRRTNLCLVRPEHIGWNSLCTSFFLFIPVQLDQSPQKTIVGYVHHSNVLQ